METQVIVAVISAAAVVIVPAVTYYLAKRKDREADWRKYKMERYQEFVTALNGIVAPGRSIEAQQRYFEACNSLHLIAAVPVLQALHAYQSEVIAQTSLDRHDELLTRLMNEARIDLQIPGPTISGSQFSVKLWYAVRPRVD